MERKTDVIIIGGGQAGLATSRCLTDMGVDHVVFERGEIAQRWKAERWNTLRLLTPNWMTRLPGWSYRGTEPDGFMHKDELARFLMDYSADFSAPVLPHTNVLSVRPDDAGYSVRTNGSTWRARSVVIATGACDTPCIPAFSTSISPRITQITLDKYKDPSQIAAGGVLVVGASASGIQIASELQGVGHSVSLTVGRHTRTPRRYRGQDIFYWLDQSGLLAEPRDPGADHDALIRHHSLQLIGTRSGRSLDLAAFQASGGQVVGRAIGADAARIALADNLTDDIQRAEARQAGVLARIDAHIGEHSIGAPSADPIAPVPLAATPAPSHIDLDAAGIKTIVWATGYRRDYAWLQAPVLSPQGEINQRGGVTPSAGFFTMGLPFMRRRNSSFIDGVGQDAFDITQHISAHLGLATAQAA